VPDIRGDCHRSGLDFHPALSTSADWRNPPKPRQKLKHEPLDQYCNRIEVTCVGFEPKAQSLNWDCAATAKWVKNRWQLWA